MYPVSTLRLHQHGPEHLHRCGPQAVYEFLAKIAEHCGKGPLILDRLAAYRRLTLELLHAVGGDRDPFPRCVRPVDPS